MHAEAQNHDLSRCFNVSNHFASPLGFFCLAAENQLLIVFDIRCCLHAPVVAFKGWQHKKMLVKGMLWLVDICAWSSSTASS